MMCFSCFHSSELDGSANDSNSVRINNFIQYFMKTFIFVENKIEIFEFEKSMTFASGAL